MSVKCMAWVLEHSESRLSDRLVLLSLAEYAHDDGTMAFPSVETLAHKARVNERTCRRSLRSLEDAGEIETMGTTRYGTVIYRVLMGSDKGGQFVRGGKWCGGQPVPEGGAITTDNGTDCPPIRKEPSVPVNLESAGARGRVNGDGGEPEVKVRGRKVKPDLWKLTDRVLAEYNSQSGSKLRLLTSSGQPSQAATRIYCRVSDYPDITFEEHADIIARTLASRWWGDTAPSIGVVFGPKVFEDNIARPAESALNGTKKDRDKKRLAAMARLMGREP